jgi:hypothetical protein
MFFCSQIFCISIFLSYAEIVALTGSQVEEDVVRGAAAGRGGAGGSSRASAGILAEEAQAIHNAKNMAMTFWNNLSGLAGDAEFDKVDTYLRMIIEKQITSKEGGNMISQFKKERMVQKHLVAAAGLESWEEFKDEFTAYWSSQEKIESLIGCLPAAARGGGTPGGRGSSGGNFQLRRERAGKPQRSGTAQRDFHRRLASSRGACRRQIVSGGADSRPRACDGRRGGAAGGRAHTLGGRDDVPSMEGREVLLRGFDGYPEIADDRGDH